MNKNNQIIWIMWPIWDHSVAKLKKKKIGSYNTLKVGNILKKTIQKILFTYFWGGKASVYLYIYARVSIYMCINIYTHTSFLFILFIIKAGLFWQAPISVVIYYIVVKI